MRPERRGAGAWRALALSVALHAALLLALLRWTAPPAPPPREPIRVSLLPRSPTAPAPSPEARSSRRAAGHPDGRPTPVAPPGAALLPETAGTPGASDVARWLGERPAGRSQEGLLALPPRVRAPGSGPAPTAEQKLRTRMGEVMDRLRAEDLARYPDASWTELRDALGAGFAAPTASLELAKRGGGAGGGGGLLGRMIEGFGPAAERYGRTGSSIAPGPGAPGAVEDTTRADMKTVAAAGAITHPERAALATAIEGLDAQPGPSGPLEPAGGLVTVVAVTLDEDGAVARVRLVARSASAAYDRAALEQAERLAGRGLSPRLAGTETEWAFITEVFVRPPSAAAAVQLDASFKPTGVALPYQRVVRTRVELRAVRRAG